MFSTKSCIHTTLVNHEKTQVNRPTTAWWTMQEFEVVITAHSKTGKRRAPVQKGKSRDAKFLRVLYATTHMLVTTCKNFPQSQNSVLGQFRPL